MTNSRKVVTPENAGVQNSDKVQETVDPGFAPSSGDGTERRNDGKMEISTYCATINHSILSIIIGKLIFATKYLCLLAATCLINTAHCHAADTVAPPEAKELLDQLSPTDCVKCHPGVVASIHSNGLAHRDKLSCKECHPGHPPRDTDIIPLCTRCHTGAAHFGLTNCLECHTNPHTPMEITLSKTITGPCTTCHNGQLEQLQEYQSIHSTLDCTACHTRHGYLPPCFNCHASHLEGMANETCQQCHKPHMPLDVNYTTETPSEYCGPCHLEAYSLLGASRAKHRNVRCAACHATRHKTIPQCQQCHPATHSQSILSQFDSCGKCHGIAHDLQLNKIDIRLENQSQ